MKKNENILNRLEQYKYKRGISYATTDGKLYKGLRIFTTLSFIYFIIFNLLFLLAELMMISLNNVKFSDVQGIVISVATCTVLIIAGYILNCTKFRLAGAILPLLPLIFNILVFYQAVSNASNTSGVLDTSNYIFNLPPFFYYRHLIPTVLLFVGFAFMAIIDIRARQKTNKLYRHLTESLYLQYKPEERSELTDEDWDNFLNNYNPNRYNRQFTLNEEDVTQEDLDNINQ